MYDIQKIILYIIIKKKHNLDQNNNKNNKTIGRLFKTITRSKLDEIIII